MKPVKKKRKMALNVPHPMDRLSLSDGIDRAIQVTIGTSGEAKPFDGLLQQGGIAEAAMGIHFTVIQGGIGGTSALHLPLTGGVEGLVANGNDGGRQPPASRHPLYCENR